jgi:hypothetical protein
LNKKRIPELDNVLKPVKIQRAMWAGNVYRQKQELDIRIFSPFVLFYRVNSMEIFL